MSRSTQMRRGRLAVAATVVAYLAAGCTDSPSAPPAVSPGDGAGAQTASSAGHQGAEAWDVSKQPNPCRTIKPDEVSAILEVRVSTSSRLDSWPPLCAFEIVKPAVQFLYVTDDSTDNGRVHFDTERTAATTVETVTGLSDAAYWVPDQTALHVLAGRTHVVVKFGGSAPPARAKDKAVAVARCILPRAAPEASPEAR